MNRIDPVAGIAASNHLSMALVFLMGLFLTRKNSDRLYEDCSDVPGDNIPVTLMESIRR